MVAQLTPHQHPILACAESISSALADVAGVQPVYMAEVDKRSALLAITRAERRLAELKLRVVASAGEVAEVDGARDVAGWLATRTQADAQSARAEEKLALAVDNKWQRVAAGMAAGVVSVEQARVIVAGLEKLPARLGAEVFAKAETQLVAYAEDHTPKELRRLARRILDVTAPEIAEAEQARLLEEEERDARTKTSFRYRHCGDGSSRGTLVVPEAVMNRLATYLEAFTSPRKQPEALSGEEDRIPYARKLGQAFCALLEHLDPKKLPQHGGDATTVLVTIGLDSLQQDLGLSTDGDLSASAVRRLACTAGIIPVVLGGKGEVLDLGRTRRLFSPAQRKALAVLHRTCAAEGCSIPARWCEAHHLRPWSRGGRTDLADAVLGCSFHHHRFHDPHYTHEILPDGKVRFHRRT